MKTILFPTDFSPNAETALHYAVSLAGLSKARLVIMHAFHVPVIAGDVPIGVAGERELELEVAGNLQEMRDRVFKQYGLLPEILSTPGFAVEEIVLKCREIEPDLVVMGTQGASGLKEAIIGSNTASVIERCESPVLAIPAGAEYRDPKKIVYATDYHDSDLLSLKKLAEWASLFDAEIEVLHVSSRENAIERTIFEWFKEMVKEKVPYKKITCHLMEGNDVEHGLQGIVEAHNADIISLSTRKRKLFDRVFGKSLTKKMAYHTKVPLLAFHIRNDASFFL